MNNAAITDIDENIVKMSFDNAEFEKGVKETITMLDKLKKSLSFDNSTFETFETTAVSSVNKVSVEFSKLEAVAIGALMNIGANAVSTGEKLIKSLSVDNIAAGWNKFGEKTGSVGTLISQGYDMDEVNEQLNKLNWYTDETSYNFTDMVSNISKFTATGQDLDDSVTAMMGIANWAALSGQNAGTASRAMYQLSQAMGAGVMRLEDYKSIQNVSMDTDEFRQKALDAAVAMGTLKKNSDGTYQSLVGASEKFTKTQFTTMLTQGRWFTSDVMMEVYKQYGSAIDPLYEYYQETGATASEGFEDLGDSLDEFGVKALKSAQEARTAADVIDSVKDAVSTGWMVTFENIFGNYEQAKTLWTKLANELYDVFAEGGNERNDILSEWNEMGGRLDFLQGLWNIFHNLVNIINAVKEAFYEVFPPMTAEKLHGITALFKELTEKLYLNEAHLNVVKTIFQGLFSAINIVLKVIKSVISGLSPILTPLKELGYYIEAIAYSIARSIIDFDQGTESFNLFKSITEAVSYALTKLLSLDLSPFFNAMITAGRIVIGVWSYILDKIKEVTGLDVAKAFDSMKRSMLTFFVQLRNYLTTDDGQIKKRSIMYFHGIARNIKNGFDEFFKSSSIVKAISEFKNRLNEKITEPFRNIKEILSKAFNFIFDLLKDAKVGNIEGFSEKLLTFVSILIQVANTGIFAHMSFSIGQFISSISGIGKGASDVLDSFKDTLESYQKTLKAAVLKSIATSVLILTASLVALSTLDHEKLATGLVGLAAILTGFTIVASKLVGLTTNITKLKNMKIIIDYLKGISSSVLMMSIAAKILSTMDMEHMISGVLGTVGLMSGVVLMVLGIAESLKRLDGMEQISQKFLAISVSLSLITSAVNGLLVSVIVLGKMKSNEVSKGFAATIGLMGGLTLMIVAIGETIRANYRITSLGKQFAAISASLILISVSINAFTPSIIAIGKLNADEAIQGFAVILGIISSMVITLLAVSEVLRRTRKVKNVSSTVIAMGAMILEISVAIDAIVPAVMALGMMKSNELEQGIFSLFRILGEMAIFFMIIQNMPNKITGGGTILALAAAIDMIIPALLIISNMDYSSLSKGITSLFKIIGEIALFFVIIGVTTHGMPSGGAAILAIGATLLAISQVLSVLVTLDPEALLSSIGALGLILGELAVFFILINKVRGGAIAMIGVAGSLAILGLALNSFAISAIAALPIAGMLSAILVFAKGMAVIGPKLFAAAPGMVSFAGSMALLGLAMTLFNGAIISFGASVGVWTEALFKIADNAKELGEAIVKILDETVKVLEPAMVLVVRLVCDIFLAIIQGLLESLYVYTEPIVRVLAEVLIIACDALGEWLGPLADAIVRLVMDLLVDVIEILADVIYRDGDRLLLSLLHVVDAVYLLIAKLLGADSDALKTYLDAGRKIMSEWTEQFTAFISVMTVCIGVLIASLTGLIGPVGVTISVLLILVATFGYLQNEFGNIGGGIAIAIGGIVLAIMGILGPLDLLVVAIAAIAWAFKDEIAKFLVDSYYFLKGYFEYVGENICKFFENLWKSISEYFIGLWNDLKEIGEFLIEGLVEGLNSAKEKVVGAVTWVGNDIVNRFKKVFKVESPSKVTKEIGEFLDSGLSSGILSGRKDVIKTLDRLGTDMIESFRDVVGVHSDSTETHEIGGFLDSGLISGIMDKAPSVLESIGNFGRSIMERFGISLDGESVAKNFLGDFQNEIENAGDVEFTNEAAKKAYKAMLDRAAGHGKILAIESGKPETTAEEILGANEASRLAAAAAERRRNVLSAYVSGTLNSVDAKAIKEEKFSIADSIVESLGNGATWGDIVNSLKLSDQLLPKDIDEYVEALKENSEKAEEINNATEAAIDPTQQALEHARELSSKFSEAKKAFDELYGYYENGFLNEPYFTSLYKDILNEYPEVQDKLLEYINKQLETTDKINDAALEAAKKTSDRVSEAKKAFDEIYGYYTDGYLSKEDFERILNTLYDEYSDVAEVFTKYVYEKMGGVIDEALDTAEKVSKRQDEAKSKLDSIIEHYNNNMFSEEDFKRILSKWMANYSDISDFCTEYLTEQVESIDNQIIKAAKKQSTRLKNFQSSFDDILELYSKGLIEFNEYEETTKELVSKYLDLGNETIDYINKKLEESDNDRLEEATGYFDKIYEYYSTGVWDWEEFEKSWTEIVSKYADQRVKLYAHAGEKMISDQKDTIQSLYDLWEEGIINTSVYFSQLDTLVMESIDGGSSVLSASNDIIIDSVSTKLQNLASTYKEKLNDIVDSIKEFADRLHITLDDAFDLKSADEVNDKLLENRKEFSEKVRTSFEDSFTLKTNKDVYDEKVSEYEEKLNKLNNSLEEASSKFGSTSLMAMMYQKQISQLTEEYEKYKKSYTNSGVKDNDIAKVTFGETIEDELKEIEEYDTELSKLKARGISDTFVKMLNEKSRKDGLAIVKYMNGLTQNEFDEISKKYKKLEEASNKLSSNLLDKPEEAVFAFKNNLKTELQKIRDYKTALEKLKSRNIISDEMMDYILSLDKDKGLSLMNGLLGMSDDEINEIQNDYTSILYEAEDVANEAFENQVKKASDEYINSIIELYESLPVKMKEIGRDTILSFALGLASGASDSIDILNDPAKYLGVETLSDLKELLDVSNVNSEELSNDITTELNEAYDKVTENSEYKRLADSAINSAITVLTAVNNFAIPAGYLVNTIASLSEKGYKNEVTVTIDPSTKPVVDMEKISYEGLTPYISGLIPDMSTNIQSVDASIKNNGKIIGDILTKVGDIEGKIGELAYSFSNAKIIMDTGRLSSQLASPINGSLGRIAIQRSR